MGPLAWNKSNPPQRPRLVASWRASEPRQTEQTLSNASNSTGLTPLAWKLGDRSTKVALSPAAPEPNNESTEVSRPRSIWSTQIETDNTPSVSALHPAQHLDRGGSQSQFSTPARFAAAGGGPSQNPRGGGRPGQTPRGGVQHGHRPQGGGHPGQNPRGGGHLGQNVGSRGRFGQNAPQTSSGFSYYKQSALPVEERDPVLLEVEQNKGRKISKALYKPGMILRVILHEPHFNFPSMVADKNRTESIFGPIHSKYRKMIVIALYEDHYIAIPIYTHEGNGLARKSKPEEYISVRDHRSKAPFITLSTHQALHTETINPGVEPYDPAATAHLTYPVSRSYDLSVVQEGQLSAASLRTLLQLYIKLAPKVNEVETVGSKQARSRGI